MPLSTDDLKYLAGVLETHKDKFPVPAHLERYITGLREIGETKNRWPELHDLVAIEMSQVEYYGYIMDIDFDLRAPRVKVEFIPGSSRWFDLSEIKLMEFPKEKK